MATDPQPCSVCPRRGWAGQVWGPADARVPTWSPEGLQRVEARDEVTTIPFGPSAPASAPCCPSPAGVTGSVAATQDALHGGGHQGQVTGGHGPEAMGWHPAQLPPVLVPSHEVQDGVKATVDAGQGPSDLVGEVDDVEGLTAGLEVAGGVVKGPGDVEGHKADGKDSEHDDDHLDGALLVGGHSGAGAGEARLAKTLGHQAVAQDNH